MLARWHARPALFFLALLICGAGSHGTDDATESTTYRTTVSEVRVSFFATDEKQDPVTTVANSDFAVVDNERIVRDFHSFMRTDETSLEVVVLVDASQSVAPRFRFAMNNVVQLAAHQQSMPDESISVLSFGGTSPGPSQERHGATPNLQPAILCSSGCRTSEALSKLLAVTSSGTTPLFGALIFGSDFISQHHRAGKRPALTPSACTLRSMRFRLLPTVEF